MNCRSYLWAAAFAFLNFAPDLRADWVEDAVKDIRAGYNAIESSKLRSESKNFESQTDPLSGTLTRYYQGDDLVKVSLSYVAGDHGGADETFYYRNGKLFFVYVAESYWSFTGATLPGGESETRDTMREHRLYFFDGQLIRHLRKEASSTSPDALKGLLAKQENKPYQDPEYAARLLRRGQGIRTATSVGEIENLVHGD